MSCKLVMEEFRIRRRIGVEINLSLTRFANVNSRIFLANARAYVNGGLFLTRLRQGSNSGIILDNLKTSVGSKLVDGSILMLNLELL